VVQKEEILDFIEDAKERLSQIESLVLSLEKSLLEKREIDSENINSLFRQFHTIKGSAGFFSLPFVVRISHEAESVLDMVRNKRLNLNVEIVEVIIQARDFLVEMIEVVQSELSDKAFEVKHIPLFQKLQTLKTLSTNIRSTEEKPEEKPKEKRFGIFKKKSKIKIDLEQPPDSDDKKEAEAKVSEDKPLTNSQSNTSGDKTVRVSTQKLDALLDIVGELVIAESLVTQHSDLEGLPLEGFYKQTIHLKQIIKDLQDVSLKLRMIPIDGLVRKMDRLVRDLSKECGKKVTLEIRGAETEIDRNMIELLNDPLIHCIRNSIDHGIETPEERLKAGKSEMGKVIIEAQHSGNEVRISILDDGRGLDKEKILQKAIENHIITGDTEAMSDADIYMLIFAPGFSTAKSVSNISGRGVGMDIVKSNVEKINGKIGVSSTPGKGVRIDLILPLTLAIIEGMVVKDENKFYIIPTLDIKETLNLRETDVIELDSSKKVIEFREKHIPVMNLSKLFDHKKYGNKNFTEKHYLIVLESKGNCLCVALDDIIGNQSVVIKPISPLFKDYKIYSGATILGNGNMGFIIDVRKLVDGYFSN
jgi:two-component system, chemotaxis family, sensor kinase CheA